MYFWGQINPTFQATEDKANFNSGLWDGQDLYQYDRSTMRTPNAKGHVIIRLNSEDSRRPRYAATIECFPGSIPFGHLPGTIERVDSIIRKADSVFVRDSTEKIGNSDCYVIEAKAKTGSYTLWIDPAHGYLIAKAQIRIGPGDAFATGYVLPKNDNTSIYVKNVRFKKTGNAWFPVEADFGRRRDFPDGRYSTQSSHYKLGEIVLNPDHDELGSFVPGDIPNGAKVRILKGNTHTEIGRYTWQDGKLEDSLGRKLNIEDIRATAFKEEPVSLMAKPLPSLEQFGAKLDPAEVGGKRILVCFWDMNQRPSRNCMRQIKNKAQALSTKGVYVILVHTEPVEEDKLEEWLRKNAVALPVCRVTGNVKQLKQEWNVQSLPWLILTDKKHVVTAEGFTLQELTEIMKGSGVNNGKK